jgi:hypothetical protein
MGKVLLATSGGNVGVGTSNPGQKLDVSGNLNVSGNITAAGNITTGGTVSFNGGTVFDSTPSGGGVNQGPVYVDPSSAAAGTTLLGAAVGGAQKFRVDSSGDLLAAGSLTTSGGVTAGRNVTAGSNVLVTGDLGIGTNTPAAQLDIEGLTPSAQATTATTALRIVGGSGSESTSIAVSGGNGAAVAITGGTGGAGNPAGSGGAITLTGGAGANDPSPNIAYQSEMVQGTPDMLILRTLVLGPAHGQTVAHAIERGSDEVLQVEHGSLYPALHRLQESRLGRVVPGDLRQQSQSEVLQADARGQKAALRPDVPLGTTGPRYWPHLETRSGEATMNWRRFFRREEADAEQLEEIESYLDLTAQEYIEREWNHRRLAQRLKGSPATQP